MHSAIHHHIHACCEAAGVYWEALACYAGYAISAVSPAQIHAGGQNRLQRAKTDRQDAALIADFCLKMTPALRQAPPPAERALPARMRDLQVLKDMLQADRESVIGRTRTSQK